MEQRRFCLRLTGNVIGVFHSNARRIGQRLNPRRRQIARLDQNRARHIGPDMRQMGLARPFGTNQDHFPKRPALPTVDTGDRHRIARGDEEILAPHRGAEGECEDQLLGHR